MISAVPFKSVVTTPAASKDLTLLATVKTELGITGTTDDAWLSVQIQQASAFAVAYCNREFAKETLVDTFRPDAAANYLSLTRWPVVTIGSVVEDDETLTAADYEVDPAAGMLYRLDGDDERRRWAIAKIVVTYEAGYVLLTDLTHDLERACIELIKRRWFARKRDPLVKGEEVPDVYNVQYWVNGSGSGAALPDDIALTLDKYRRIAVG